MASVQGLREQTSGLNNPMYSTVGHGNFGYASSQSAVIQNLPLSTTMCQANHYLQSLNTSQYPLSAGNQLAPSTGQTNLSQGSNNVQSFYAPSNIPSPIVASNTHEPSMNMNSSTAVRYPPCEEKMHQKPTGNVSTPTTKQGISTTDGRKGDSYNQSNLDLLSELSISNPVPVTSSPPPPSKPTVPMPGSQVDPAVPSVTSVSLNRIVPVPNVDTLSQVSEEDKVSRISAEVERLQNVVSNLNSKTLGGQSSLDVKWKEVLALVESKKSKLSVSVARCYPGKNTVPDVLPYDQNRVILKDTRDDYINASRITSPNEEMISIVTQSHHRNNHQNFWRMIWQEGTELMVCLVMDQELGQSSYLPVDKNSIEVGGFSISIKSIKMQTHVVERVLNITNEKNKQTRAIMHLQMLGWPGSDLPISPSCLLDAAIATLQLKRQQRVVSRPLLIHCMDGGSKCATFLALLWLLVELGAPNAVCIPPQGMPDVTNKLVQLLLQRKGILRDKQHIRLIHEALLYFLQDTLMKQGILNTGNTPSLSKKGHSRHPSQDFVGLSVTSLKQELNTTSTVAEVGNTQKLHSDNNVESNRFETTDGVDEDRNTSCIESGCSDMTPQAEAKSLAKNIPDDLSKLADISIDDVQTKKSKKITKEDFLNPLGSVSKVNDSDPLSQLDPLWSLK